MRLNSLVLAAAAAVLIAAPAFAAPDRPTRPADDDHMVTMVMLEQTAVVQKAVARFWNPVIVGDRILMGKYIIEHDTARMARGEACTHIYDFYNPKKLVLAFHCTHLTRPAPTQGTVTVIPYNDLPGLRRVTEFQYAGDAAAHGVPRR